MRLPFWLFVIWDCPIGFCYLSSETSFLAFCYLRPPFRFLLPCFFLLYGTAFLAFFVIWDWLFGFVLSETAFLAFLLSETGKPTHWTTSSAFSPGRPSIIQTILSCKSFTPATQIGQPNLSPEKKLTTDGPPGQTTQIGQSNWGPTVRLEKKTTGSPEQTIQTRSCNKLLAPVSHS